jgi:multidrug efflux pump subunit AcrA (membrane-fusion protein)
MPGMTANAEIECERVDDVLWVPNDALFEKDGEDGKQFVAVVTGGKDDKSSPSAHTGEKKGGSFLSGIKGGKGVELTTEDREVTTGLANDSRAEIKSGLQEGEEIELGKAAIPERKIIDIKMESKNDEDEGEEE